MLFTSKDVTQQCYHECKQPTAAAPTSFVSLWSKYQKGNRKHARLWTLNMHNAGSLQAFASPVELHWKTEPGWSSLK
eukprot:685919-Amphidinium_carterae.1